MKGQGIGLRYRVGVIDDDPWRCRGVAEALRDAGGVIDVIGHGEVEASAGIDHGDADVLLVGLDARSDTFDRFAPLVEAARIAARPRAEGEPPALLVGLSAARGHPLLPLRAAEAGIDHLYWWDEVGDVAALEELVLTPSLSSRPLTMVSSATLRQVGLTASSTLNRGLAWIETTGRCDVFVDPPTSQLSRRQRITVREKLASLMRATSSECGSASAHDRSLPSWSQLRQLIDLARGATDVITQPS